MKSKQELLDNLHNLDNFQMRTLNRYYLHPINQRCCSECLKVYDDYTKHFHIKKHTSSGVSYNVKCASCFNSINQARKLSYRKNPHQFIRSRLTSYSNRARLEKCEYNLTSEALINQWDTQGGLCFYTEAPISFELVGGSGKAPHNSTPSLDRLDPSKGYVIGNVVWCAYAINRMKNEFTYDEFILMCKHITEIRNQHD